MPSLRNPRGASCACTSRDLLLMALSILSKLKIRDGETPFLMRAIRNPHGMNYIHAACDRLLRALKEPQVVPLRSWGNLWCAYNE